MTEEQYVEDQNSIRGCSDIDKQVGLNIRRLRLAANMSQEKLGERLGLTFQQVQKYEKGVNRISAGRLFELAQIFCVKIAEFYLGVEGADDDAGPSAFNEVLYSREGAEIVHAFAQATPQHRSAILSLTRNLNAATAQAA